MTKRLVPAGALALTLAFTGPVPALAGTALVGNENGGTISLIDTARDEVVGEIKTGGKPRGTAIHRIAPDRVRVGPAERTRSS